MQAAEDGAAPLSPLDEAASLEVGPSSPVLLQHAGSKGGAGGAADAAGAADGAAAGGGEPGGGTARASMGLTGLSTIGADGSPQQRREWVLHKLCGLVDSIKLLEDSAYVERLADANQGGCWVLRPVGCCGSGGECGWPQPGRCGACRAGRGAHCAPLRFAPTSAAGLPAFMLVVHACVNLTRQCGACLTALDQDRGRQLHGYYIAARAKAVQRSGPTPGIVPLF